MLGCLTVVVYVMAGCKGNTTPTDSLSHATIIVDGQSFQPSANGMSALDRGSNVIDINLSDCRAGASVNLSLRGPLAVGTVANNNIFQAMFFNGSGQWDWKNGQGRGTLVLTAVSPRIVGTYEFDMQPTSGAATGTKFVTGSFDVSFGNGTACK
jgi:hypothetical protein